MGLPVKKYTQIDSIGYTPPKMEMLLAGDIGGTKTHLALYDERYQLIREEKVASREFATFIEVLRSFVKGETIDRACFGVAGPVKNGHCKATNLPWVVDAKEIQTSMQIRNIFVINDLEANAWGVRALKPEELCTLNPGAEEKGNRALIAAGTGLGEAGLYWDGHQHLPFASEGGHTDFAPRDELEMELLRYLKTKYPHVSYERILSGAGIYALYRFLIDLRLEKEPEGFVKLFAGEDPAKVIAEKALKQEIKACRRTLEWFVSLYGSEAGHLALKYLAVGGVYLGGGIAPKILPLLQEGGFMKAFVNKGRFQELLSKIPVHVILNDRAALLGALEFLKQDH